MEVTRTRRDSQGRGRYLNDLIKWRLYWSRGGPYWLELRAVTEHARNSKQCKHNSSQGLHVTRQHRVQQLTLTTSRFSVLDDVSYDPVTSIASCVSKQIPAPFAVVGTGRRMLKCFQVAKRPADKKFEA